MLSSVVIAHQMETIDGTKYNRSSKVVIANSEARVLILLRSASQRRRALQWELPGGTLYPDEDAAVGAKREVKEETGLILPWMRAFWAVDSASSQGDHTNRRTFFYTRLPDFCNPPIRLDPREHEDHRWAPFEEAHSKVSHAVHKEALERCVDLRYLTDQLVIQNLQRP